MIQSIDSFWALCYEWYTKENKQSIEEEGDQFLFNILTNQNRKDTITIESRKKSRPLSFFLALSLQYRTLLLPNNIVHLKINEHMGH